MKNSDDSSDEETPSFSKPSRALDILHSSMPCSRSSFLLAPPSSISTSAKIVPVQSVPQELSLGNGILNQLIHQIFTKDPNINIQQVYRDANGKWDVQRMKKDVAAANFDKKRKRKSNAKNQQPSVTVSQKKPKVNAFNTSSSTKGYVRMTNNPTGYKRMPALASSSSSSSSGTRVLQVRAPVSLVEAQKWFNMSHPWCGRVMIGDLGARYIQHTKASRVQSPFTIDVILKDDYNKIVNPLMKINQNRILVQKIDGLKNRMIRQKEITGRGWQELWEQFDAGTQRRIGDYVTKSIISREAQETNRVEM